MAGNAGASLEQCPRQGAGWSRPGRVMQPCFSLFFTSHQLMGYAVIPPAIAAIPMTNQKSGDLGFREAGMRLVRMTMAGIIPTMTVFIDTVSAKSVLRTASR